MSPLPTYRHLVAMAGICSALASLPAACVYTPDSSSERPFGTSLPICSNGKLSSERVGDLPKATQLTKVVPEGSEGSPQIGCRSAFQAQHGQLKLPPSPCTPAEVSWSSLARASHPWD